MGNAETVSSSTPAEITPNTVNTSNVINFKLDYKYHF